MDFQKLINEILNEIKIDKSYRKIIFSNTKNAEFEKIIIKPIQLKNGEAIQIESFKNNKVFHKNIDIKDNDILLTIIDKYVSTYSQILVQKLGLDLTYLKKKNKNDFSKKENKNNFKEVNLEHNKKKKYILNEGEKIDFLIELDVMTEDGKVLKANYNKFRQINKYLEFIDDSIK